MPNSTTHAKTRLFFALWPDAETRVELVRSVRTLELPHGRRVPAENLHITLVFLGSIAYEQQLVVEAVADRVQMREFELVLDTLGYWRRPQVAWIGVQYVPEDLLQLAADLRDGLKAAGVAVESRPYVPHLTVLRKARDVKAMPLRQPIAWPVTGFALVASHDSVGGVRYKLVRGWQNCPAG